MENNSYNEKTFEFSEYTKEILGTIPHSIIRFGSAIMLTFFFLVAIILNFIKYPEVVSSQVEINRVIPAAKLISKGDGRIDKIFVSNGSLVKKGQLIAIIENTATLEDILKLKNCINKVKVVKEYAKIPHGLNLGEIQNPYNRFIRAIDNYSIYLEINRNDKQKLITQSQSNEYKYTIKKKRNQLTLSNEEFQIANKEFQRYKVLYEAKAISNAEFESKKVEYLRAQMNYENSQLSLDNEEANRKDLDKNLLEYSLQNQEDLQKFALDIDDSFRELKSSFLKWKNTYFIEAPIDGKVSYLGFWLPNVNIKIGDEFASIVPVENKGYIARMSIPMINAGKVKVSQKVMINLDNYSAQEYGSLEGIVKNIYPVPKQKNYLIEISVPQNFNSTYNKKLIYQEGMSGIGNIVTKDITLLKRIFYQLRALIDGSPTITKNTNEKKETEPYP